MYLCRFLSITLPLNTSQSARLVPESVLVVTGVRIDDVGAFICPRQFFGACLSLT